MSSSVSMRRPGSASSVRSTDRRDVEKADALVEEGGHRDFVGGVQHGRRPAAGQQRRARDPQRREARRVGRLESEPRQLGEIELAGWARECGRASRARWRWACACRASPAAPAPSRRCNRPGRAPPIADAPPPRCARSASRNRWCASITSRPLFIMVAESTEILAPMLQFGMLHRLLGGDVRHLLQRALAERPAAGGQHDALDRVRAGRNRTPGRWRCARCPPARAARRNASPPPSPAPRRRP